MCVWGAGYASACVLYNLFPFTVILRYIMRKRRLAKQHMFLLLLER